jgi:hypothetical protein
MDERAESSRTGETRHERALDVPVNGSPYGTSENYGSPGGDEPPETTDPGSGTAGSARERVDPPAAR